MDSKVLQRARVFICCAAATMTCFALLGCSPAASEVEQQRFVTAEISDTPRPEEPEPAAPTPPEQPSTEQLWAELGVVEDYRPSFVHGPKPPEYQRYIVLHDTEGDSSPEEVISWWEGNGNLVAAHFVVGVDGRIFQCVPLDAIAHHAGFGDIGHNDLYGIFEDGRDDLLGTVSIGPDYPDYGMNAWSIGIEMVHIGGSGYYPEEQLIAVDKLINYLDSYYAGTPQGNAGAIIDHKNWRSNNSDTSPEFAGYLANYQSARRHA